MPKIDFSTLQDNNAFPFGIGVARGAFPNLSGIQKFGYNPSVAATEETVWSAGGTYSYISTAGTAAVTTSSTDDNNGTVEIQGLDANYNLQTVTATIAGSATTETFIRVFRVRMLTPGTGQTTNVGNITVTVDSTTAAYIPAGEGQTLQAVYTVPADKRAYLLSVVSGTEKEKEITTKLIARPNGGSFNVKTYETARGRLERKYLINEVFDEKTDIELRVSADADTGISGGFELLLEDK